MTWFLSSVGEGVSPAMNPPALKGFSGSRRSLMLQGCDTLEPYLRHHSFVLNRIEGAGGVHHAATRLEKACRLQANAQLQGVESIAVDGSPTAPYISSLAYCTISAAGHVTQDTIVLHLAALQYTSSPEMSVVTELRMWCHWWTASGQGSYETMRLIGIALRSKYRKECGQPWPSMRPTLPVPEWNASQLCQMLDKILTCLEFLLPTRGKRVASWLVMTMAGLQMRLVWCASMLQRWASASFAITKPAQQPSSDGAVQCRPKHAC